MRYLLILLLTTPLAIAQEPIDLTVGDVFALTPVVELLDYPDADTPDGYEITVTYDWDSEIFEGPAAPPHTADGPVSFEVRRGSEEPVTIDVVEHHVIRYGVEPPVDADLPAPFLIVERPIVLRFEIRFEGSIDPSTLTIEPIED